MTHRLDVVPVGVEHEGAVVVRVVVRAQTRRTVVLAARRKRGLVERIDGRAVLRGDCDVHGFVQAAFAADPEVRLAAGAEAEAAGLGVVLVLLHFHDQHVAERRQRLLVKCLGTCVVRYREADVVDHVSSSR